MIFTDRTITVKKGVSSIDDSVILYRGDKDVEIRFTLSESSPFRFGVGSEPNIIERTEAAYGQLIIKAPNDLPSIFSEVVPTNEGKIIFTITTEMIDEITEVGNYTFQIRLLDESMNSRATLPEVVDGIEIREPIATEDITDTNEVGIATVGYALTTAGIQEDAFDGEGNYKKTTWATGDRITAAKLDKIEAGIDGVNKKVASGGTGGEVDLSGYVTKEVGNASQITFADGQTFQAKLDAGTLKGEKGDTGEQGIQGEKGEPGQDGLTTAISVNSSTYTHVEGTITLPDYPTVPTNISQLNNDSNYATETFVQNKIAEASLSGGEVDLSAYQTKTDNALNTTDKTVVGAINGINETMVIAEEQAGDMTVGGISVVGVDSVLEKNIVDGAVTPRKTNFFKKINLFNYATSTAGKRIADTTGVLINDASFNTSDFIEVEPSIDYTLNIANYDTVFVFDESKTILTKFNLKGWGIVVNTITMPENAKYVRISYLSANESEIMFVKGNKIPNEYCSHDDLIIEYPKQNVFDEKPSLQGTYLFFGDSICYGAGYAGGYSKIIAKNNPKMAYVNYGVSGSSVAKRASRSDSVLEKVAEAQDKADFIVLEGGVNDAWSSEIELGDFNATASLTSSYISNLVDTTYTGALETLFNNVQTKWPGKLVFFIIPHNMDLPNTKSFMDRAEEICQKWGVILIDLRKLSGMNTYNEYIKTTYTNSGDGVHPNQSGYEKYYIKPITNILRRYN